MVAVKDPIGSGSMNASERRSQIAQLVREQGRVQVADLVKKYDLTETSIRRDLALLEEDRLLKRVHGGAISIPGNIRTDTYAEKEKQHIRAKESIGLVAAGMVKQGDVVLIASGTTTLQVIKFIPPELRMNNLITLVTTSMPIAHEVLTWPSPNLTILGGLYLPDYQATVGPQTIHLLKDISADIAFLGTDGLKFDNAVRGNSLIGEIPATTANILIAETDRVMAAQARKTFLLADSSKIGQSGFVPIRPLKAFDALITDQDAPEEFVRAARKEGIDVIIAEEALGSKFDY